MKVIKCIFTKDNRGLYILPMLGFSYGGENSFWFGWLWWLWEFRLKDIVH